MNINKYIIIGLCAYRIYRSNLYTNILSAYSICPGKVGRGGGGGGEGGAMRITQKKKKLRPERMYISNIILLFIYLFNIKRYIG